MRWNRFFVTMAAVGALMAGPSLVAQDPEDAPVPAQPAAGDASTTPGSEIRLYVALYGGVHSADPFNTSIQTRVTDVTTGSMLLEDQQFGRVAVGWKLPKGKGDARLVFNGYKEDGYDFRSTGLQNRIRNGGTGSDTASSPLLWWTLAATNGTLVSSRTPPLWTDTGPSCAGLPAPPPGSDDTNCNGVADPDEVTYDPDAANFPISRSDPVYRTVTRPIVDDLQNRLQTIDLLYGREFGGRRFSSRWFTGLRYFQYQGTMLATAWLQLDRSGIGFTDGAFLSPLHLAQDTSGFGPTGSWEVDFNFFNKGLVLFTRAQSALSFSQLSVDSGTFVTLVRSADTNSPDRLTGESRLNESRDKTTWQNTIEAGARVLLRNGLQLEVGYSLTGFLDAILLPSVITIPDGANQLNAGTSALYGTQDYRLDGWHAGLAFQF